MVVAGVEVVGEGVEVIIDVADVRGANVEVAGCVIVGAELAVEVGVDSRYDSHPVIAVRIIMSNSENNAFLIFLAISKNYSEDTLWKESNFHVDYCQGNQYYRSSFKITPKKRS